MSYDISLHIDTGGPEPAWVGKDWNYTTNCAPMWRLAMPETDGLAGMHGLLAKDAAGVLKKGIARMEKDPAAYRALNPENGWGSFDGEYGTFQALRRLLANCEAHPRATVRVHR